MVEDEDRRRRAVLWSAAGLVAALAIGAGAFVLHDKTAKTVAAAGAPFDLPVIQTHSDAGTDAGTGALPSRPANTVLASCLQIDNLGTSTDVVPTFLVTPLAAGTYTVTLTTSVGSLTGSATANPGATFVAVPVHFNSFATISSITIAGPGGPIDSGTFSAIIPFTLDQKTDVATDCDGSKLTAPASGPDDVVAAVKKFLDGLASNFRSGNVDASVSILDPSVLQIHTADQCRATISTFTDPTFALVVHTVDGPKPFDFVIGGTTVHIQTGFFVAVSQTTRGKTADLTVHLSRSGDGSLHWFTTCEQSAN